MKDKILNYTREIEDELINLRRDFHAFPEKGWEEVRTSSIIASILTKLGYEVLIGEDVCEREDRMGVPIQKELDYAYNRAMEHGAIPEYAEKMKDGMTGVIGIMEFENPGPTIAMRFDIDALPIYESDDENHAPTKGCFVSTIDGNMHACGHDGHAAIGIGVAKQLANIKDELKGKVVLIFQPAEEGVRGAKSIVTKGHLDDAEYFLASHITEQPEGVNIDLFPGGSGALATTKLNVEIKGRAAHAGGSPQLGHNASLAMATIISNLNAIPRHSGGATRLNVGVAKSGTGRNVIPDSAHLEIESRGATTEINEYVRNYALNIIEHGSKMHFCEATTSLEGEAFSLESDEKLMEIVGECSKELGYHLADDLGVALTGSEDVSYMMKRVQDNGGLATFMRILTPVAGVAHNEEYDFDEKVIAKGVNVFTYSTYALMNLKK